LDLPNNEDFKRVESLAEGTQQADVFFNYEMMVKALNAFPVDTYRIDQDIRVIDLDVPDLWVSAVAEESIPYAYVDDDTLVTALNANGQVQIGYFVLSVLETKTDLNGYIKNTDIADSNKAGVIEVSVGNSAAVVYRNPNDKRLTLGNMNRYIDERITQNAIRNKDLDYAIKVGITGLKTSDGVTTYGNQIALTDAEKAAAQEWLGIDTLVGDIETALDAIITKQNSLIGGDS
jgi:hypothetical protein